MMSTTVVESLVGEFIEVPAWNRAGMVIDQRAPDGGPEGTVCVRLQVRPDQYRADCIWYTLQPGTFDVV